MSSSGPRRLLTPAAPPAAAPAAAPADAPVSRRTFVGASAGAAAGAALSAALPAGLSAAAWARVPGANARLRLGVIGTGGRGRDVMGAFLRQPDVSVVALSDAWDEAANQARAKAGAQAAVHADYRALLDRKDVDAVLIATPDHWHAQMAVDACRAGKDVYIEKPLTFKAEEGHAIARAVRESARVMQVGLQQRSGPHYLQAKREYFDSGRIGKVTYVRTWWHGNSWHLRKPDFTAQPAGLDWARWLGPARMRPFDAQQFWNWRAYLDFGGGTITDLFTHWIDVAHLLTGDDVPASAVATGGVYQYNDGRTAPDTVNVLLEYPRNWTASFEATLAPGGRGAAVELIGTGGSLLIDRQQFTFRPAGGDPPVTVKAEGDLTDAHVRNFLDCVASRRAPNSDVVSGHRSALASHLGKQAYLEKRRVAFDPPRERAALG
jgi:predicted dehydrogenase